MDGDILGFAQVMVIIVASLASITLIGVTAYKILSRGPRRPAEMARHDDDRLEHLQQSIDAIAVEVERIAEAQRFSAKLLVERDPERSIRS